MKKNLIVSAVLCFLLTACNLPSAGLSQPTITAAALSETTATQPPVADTPTSTVTALPTETLTPTIAPPKATNTSTEIPVAESLNATVTADLLSCRYGPGGEYLYFYGFNKDLKLKLIGRAIASNWVMVGELQHPCWVNTKFISVEGDPQTLKITYPGDYNLPNSPYYSSPTGVSATRSGSSVTVSWDEMALRPGDEEDENMFIYIVEAWRCEGGQIIFDSLASNYPEVTFIDEAGCDAPSHGRVFFQEKHGFAGPSDILPWP